MSEYEKECLAKRLEREAKQPPTPSIHEEKWFKDMIENSRRRFDQKCEREG